MEGSEVTTTISSFEELRETNSLYVDKTAYLARLVMGKDKLFSFSRPRRFGKTLTVSTLEAIFQGKRELFKGLAIDALDYDWKSYPVVHIDFSDCPASTREGLESWLRSTILDVCDTYGIQTREQVVPATMFSQLLMNLSAQGKIVLLIDEYDKAISDHALSDNVLELRDTLKEFYQVIKKRSEILRFVFITGVTKFSKMGIFSGINNLYDASLDPDYGTMLGYT